MAPAQEPIIFERSMSPLKNSQRGEQLAASPILTPTVEAERSQRIDGRDASYVAAVVALHAPDGNQDLRRHTVAHCRSIDVGTKLQPLVLTQRNTLRRHGAVEVDPDRTSGLGLRSVQFNNTWQVADIGECDV
jgi:hypothetical protein